MKRSFVILVGALLFIGGLAVGVLLTQNLLLVHWDFVAPGRLYSAEPKLDLPTLQTITAGATTDDDALQAVAAYFDAHRDQIQAQFSEPNPTRLKALYALYVTHISHAYDVVPVLPDSFLAYLAQPTSHCGTFSRYQAAILTRLGVAWRVVNISGDTHTFIEAKIDGRWEVFDASTNVWIDTSAFEMERGAPRHSRAFYTPLLDENYPVAISAGALRGGQELRAMLPGLGVYFFPKAALFVSDESTSEAG